MLQVGWWKLNVLHYCRCGFWQEQVHADTTQCWLVPCGVFMCISLSICSFALHQSCFNDWSTSLHHHACWLHLYQLRVCTPLHHYHLALPKLQGVSKPDAWVGKHSSICNGPIIGRVKTSAFTSHVLRHIDVCYVCSTPHVHFTPLIIVSVMASNSGYKSIWQPPRRTYCPIWSELMLAAFLVSYQQQTSGESSCGFASTRAEDGARCSVTRRSRDDKLLHALLPPWYSFSPFW